MRLVIQRVTSAAVRVDGQTVGEIGKGLLVLLGVGRGDTDDSARLYAKKLLGLRIFEDENGKTNRSLADVGGALLIVSQFTLYADCSHGNRPGFTQAGDPAEADRLYQFFASLCREAGAPVQTGIFGADMKVSLVNDGPFTIVLDESLEKK